MRFQPNRRHKPRGRHLDRGCQAADCGPSVDHDSLEPARSNLTTALENRSRNPLRLCRFGLGILASRISSEIAPMYALMYSVRSIGYMMPSP